MPGSASKLHVGDAAPDFTLADSVTGAMVSLESLLGEHSAALLAFHRGIW
jgi:peroxiredoxin